ncbi:homogentisate phytyltransferase [Phormidesmis priestleyi ULC007]|uniref:Homogentisate phytyltransferase n=1 Tax=Phormidesmis priestleyi ULC007 TaxID=1920490 RepID=A0A2T1DCM3_9CYAN|nr:homogentisate phytyltransferase [Phormidesmis priestleyi]PSB18217.1 homogentisate phytyltransferase [Phormidesmis priestleyi ULC007]PZO49488.1 MAG: homogentisate phytyltransferase [Phormidesmis priestleyi]
MSRTSPKSSVSFVSNPVQRYAPGLYAFWKFSRPHTIIGTSCSVLGMYFIAAANQPFVFEPFSWFLPLLACLCGNVYIVGLNQLEDVEIDRINKPHLPLASGEFSRTQGVAIVTITGILAILLAALQGQYLLGMVGLSLAIGTAYSLPPIRLKRFPFWASLCIFSVRGAIVNLGLFLHFNHGFPIPPKVWALTLFVLVFTFAIAIFKDIPDMEGDRQYNISTFTLRVGQKAVFDLSRWVLTACYLGMVAAAFWLPSVNAPFLIVSHLLLVSALWLRSQKVDLHEPREVAKFYQFIWKMFFLEYLIFAIACLLH